MTLPDNKDLLSHLLKRTEADRQVADAYQSCLPISKDPPVGESLRNNIPKPTYHNAHAHGDASSLKGGNAVYRGQQEAISGNSYLANNEEPATSYPSRAGSWQPPMGNGAVSLWSGGQDATAGPGSLVPRKPDERPEIPRVYLSHDEPEVRSYLQSYLYNKGNGWKLSKLCNPCVRAKFSAGMCTRGDSDNKCAQCQDKGLGKGTSCHWRIYHAAKAFFKKQAGQEIDREESYAERLTRERREKRIQEKADKARELEEMRERWREEQRRRPIEDSCVYQPSAPIIHPIDDETSMTGTSFVHPEAASETGLPISFSDSQAAASALGYQFSYLSTAPTIHIDGETSVTGVVVPSYDSQPAASDLTYPLPVSTDSGADVPCWSTAPSESEASFVYGGTGYDRASYSTASSIPDDYTTGSHTPVLPHSAHTAVHPPKYARPPSHGGHPRDAVSTCHVDGEWKYDELSGGFMKTRMIPEKREPEVSAEQVQQYNDQHRQPHDE